MAAELGLLLWKLITYANCFWKIFTSTSEGISGFGSVDTLWTPNKKLWIGLNKKNNPGVNLVSVAQVGVSGSICFQRANLVSKGQLGADGSTWCQWVNLVSMGQLGVRGSTR
ncbi:hypothetical protein ACFE04_000073 [Oxalis oulophora]